MNIRKIFRIKYYREIFRLKDQFFRNQKLLNINNKISISKGVISINKKKLNEIYDLLNEHDYIHKDSIWFSILSNHHIKFLNYVNNNKDNLKYALDNPNLFNIFYGFDDNCEILYKFFAFSKASGS